MRRIAQIGPHPRLSLGAECLSCAHTTSEKRAEPDTATPHREQDIGLQAQTGLLFSIVLRGGENGSPLLVHSGLTVVGGDGIEPPTLSV